MALWNSRNLQMRDPPARQVMANFVFHIALHNLAVVEVKLNFEVGCANLLHQRMGRVLVV